MMRMIHVLRKPLSEGTVAANTLKHGTGGLNIDEARIASPGEAIQTHSRSPEASAKENRPVYGEYGPLKTHQTEGQKRGRWPANVILQHLDGCRCEGVKRVKGIGGGATSGHNAFGQDSGWNAHQNRLTNITRQGGKDGKETVANWVCEPGCPAARLDEQSGTVRSSGGGGNRTGVLGGLGLGFNGIPADGCRSPQYADTGGASRFYKQVGGKADE